MVDWIRIKASFACTAPNSHHMPDCIYTHHCPTFIPMSSIFQVRRIDDKDQLSVFEQQRGTDNSKQKGSTWLEKIERFSNYPEEVYPIYCVYVKDTTVVYPREITGQLMVNQGIWAVVHWEERERMERYLAGTHNPLYDLVHELRYNPVVGVAPEKEAAKVDFNNK